MPELQSYNIDGQHAGQQPPNATLPGNQPLQAPATQPPLGSEVKYEYLRDLPLDWLSDATDLFSQTLQLGGLMGGAPKSLGAGLGGAEGEEEDKDIKAVVQGKKQVSVPPGESSRHCIQLLVRTVVRQIWGVTVDMRLVVLSQG